jgi:hypothetical protein
MYLVAIFDWYLASGSNGGNSGPFLGWFNSSLASMILVVGLCPQVPSSPLPPRLPAPASCNVAWLLSFLGAFSLKASYYLPSQTPCKNRTRTFKPLTNYLPICYPMEQ